MALTLLLLMDDRKCFEEVHKLRWPDGVRCYTLKSADTHYTVRAHVLDYVKESDISSLITLLDSKEPCAHVVHSLSSIPPLNRSTVSHEAAYLIEGFWKRYYPTELSSHRYMPDIEAIKHWYAVWSNMKKLAYTGDQANSHQPAAHAQVAGGSNVIAEGEWSKSVTDARGFAVRGRLVLCQKLFGKDRREVVVYMELQDACDFINNRGIQLFCDFGKTDFRPEYKGGLQCEMRSRDKRIISFEGNPFGGAVPLSEWVRLPTDATVRMRATPFGIHRAKAMAISPELNKLWVIDDGNPNEYFLSGTFTIDPATDKTPPGEEHVWRGTIELPPVKIVNLRK